jgi:hypothetical protein
LIGPTGNLPSIGSNAYGVGCHLHKPSEHLLAKRFIGARFFMHEKRIRLSFLVAVKC